MDVDVRVVASDERRVGDDAPVRRDDAGVLGEVEARGAPVREQVVELEVGRAVLVDVARDHELGDRLRVVERRRAGDEIGGHQ
jgi:hypothetical protein